MTTDGNGGPGLAFAFDLRLEFRTSFTYPSVSGERGFTSLTGGTVEGPKLTGAILPGGGDFPVLRPDGVAEFDSRHMIEAADGTHIYMRNRGIQRDGYIRCSPIFDTPVGPHDWLTKTVFVGTGTSRDGGVDFRIYEVL
jgi:hypothetical protein